MRTLRSYYFEMEITYPSTQTFHDRGFAESMEEENEELIGEEVNASSLSEAISKARAKAREYRKGANVSSMSVSRNRVMRKLF